MISCPTHAFQVNLVWLPFCHMVACHWSMPAMSSSEWLTHHHHMSTPHWLFDLPVDCHLTMLTGPPRYLQPVPATTWQLGASPHLLSSTHLHNVGMHLAPMCPLWHMALWNSCFTKEPSPLVISYFTHGFHMSIFESFSTPHRRCITAHFVQNFTSYHHLAACGPLNAYEAFL